MAPVPRRQMHAMSNSALPAGIPTALRVIVFGLLLAAVPWAVSAQSNAADPRSDAPTTVATPATDALDPATLRARIQLLKARTELPSGERELVLDQLTSALARALSAETARKAADGYAATLKAAPETIAALEARTAAAEQAPVTAPALPADDDRVRTQLRLASLQAEAVSLRGSQRELEVALAAMVTRPQQARAELVELRRELDQEQAAFPANATPLLADASRLREEAGRQDLSARVEKTEQELLTLPTRESITVVQRDLGVRRLQGIEQAIDTLQSRINALREAEASRQVREARDAVRQLADSPAPMREFALGTVALRASALQISERLDVARTLQESLRTRLDRIAESRRSADQILGVGRIGDGYGHLLRGLGKELPTQAALARRGVLRDDSILEARVRRLHIQRQRQALDDEGAVKRLLAEAGLAATPGTLAMMTGLVEARSAALDDLQQMQAPQVEAMAETNALDAELLQRTQQLRSLLDERLLWLPSATPLGAEWAQQLGQGALWLVSADNATVLPSALASTLRTRPLIVLLLVAGIVALFATRRRLKRMLETLAQPVGQRHDSFRITLLSMLVTLLLALPLPLLVGGLGWALDARDAPASFASALGAGLLGAGVVLFMLGVFQAMCRPPGLFVAHFGWDAQGTERLRRALRLLAIAIAPAALLTTLANADGTPAMVDGFGRLGFMIGSLALALFLYRVFRPHNGALTRGLDRGGLAWRTRHLWFWALVITPVALALLAAVGYYATASELQSRLFTSGWIILATVIGYRVAMRGVLVAGRRTAYEQAAARHARARAEALEKASAEAGDDAMPVRPEEPEIDVVSVSQQTRALLRAAAAIVLLLVLWGIWKSMVPALGVFDDVVLWSHLVTGAGGDTIAAVTLGDVLLGVLLLGLTVIAARNLPGFLEITVLQRFGIDLGTRYAVGSIARYLILAVGLVIAFNRLGAEWSKLQWIVAALGVGLGFGLQEIVANFVSGIIILFERPVRVGDVVTIGSTSGTVTRIKIRATTITDFDNFEVLVPNKSFITETVQNWTLTSAVTRLTLKVGIAYGSDVARAQRLMLDAVQSNEQVLDSPEPTALFAGFGDSTLDFEIRVFVGRVEQRLPTLHDLYVALNATLEEAGIEIPFPQRDVHLRHREPSRDED